MVLRNGRMTVVDNSNIHQFSGVHVFGEMYGVSFDDLNNLELLTSLLKDGIERSGASLCSLQEKKFSPNGLTILALLSESHASIHTYPEEGALFFDAFTCGERCNPSQISDVLLEGLKPKHHDLQIISRGYKFGAPHKLTSVTVPHKAVAN